MDLDTAKTLIEIGILVVGSGGVTLVWSKLTNSKKLKELQKSYDVLQDKYDHLNIDCTNIRDELNTVKSANKTMYDFMDVVETAVMNDEDAAKAMVDFLIKKKEVLKK